jgi:putative ABC transport system permease protein
MSNFSLNLAWRLFKHETRRGELTIILLAIVLAVSSVLSLSLFSERLQSALSTKSAEFIAADRVLSARKPVAEAWLERAQALELDTAQQVRTRSMVFAKQHMLLAELRAAGPGYPLKGQLKVSDQAFSEGAPTSELPGPGEAWVESRLMQSLALNIGDSLDVGDAAFTVTKVLVSVPDAGFSVFAGDPKVLIPLSALPATNLTGPGSRVSYSYYFVGDTTVLDEYYTWLRPQLDREIHDWNSVDDDDSPLGRSVQRAEQYFLLASLLAIVLAAVSIAVAAQRYSQRHYDPVAIMKTLGATGSQVKQVYVLQILFISTLGILIGGLIGFLLQQAVVWALAGQLDVSMDAWHWRPVFIAIFTGAVCAFLFSLYPLLKLFSVSPLRVLRRDLGANLSSRAIQFIASGGAIFLLMWAYSQNLQISAILFVSGILLVLALLLVTFGLIWLGRRLGQGKMGAWRLAWARIHRRALDNSVQLISFAITIMLLLVVLVMRNDMVKQWQDQLPQGTPNYFLINISQEQMPNLAEHFNQSDVSLDKFYPVVRGRFVAINDEKIRTDISKEEESAGDSGRQGLGREANLTWNTQLQIGSKIVAGRWFDENTSASEEQMPFEVSVEERLAQRLGINLGDTLTFNIGSEVVSVKVTSLRDVNWQSMQPNFFFVIEPRAMAQFVPTYMSSFYLPIDDKSKLTELLQPFASVTLFDVDAQINQLRSIVEQVSVAVEFILVLVLIAGSLVLVAQVQASMDERQQELAILRTLGAKGSLIRWSVICEFVIIGMTAGFMAATFNELSLYLLQTEVFSMQATLHAQFFIIAPISGAIVVACLGGISCWRLLRLNTSHLLRQMV